MPVTPTTTELLLSLIVGCSRVVGCRSGRELEGGGTPTLTACPSVRSDGSALASAMESTSVSAPHCKMARASNATSTARLLL